MQTVPEESRAQGTIGFKMYVKYLRSGASMLALLMVILVNIGAQVNRKHSRRHSLISKCEERVSCALLRFKHTAAPSSHLPGRIRPAGLVAGLLVSVTKKVLVCSSHVSDFFLCKRYIFTDQG